MKTLIIFFTALIFACPMFGQRGIQEAPIILTNINVNSNYVASELTINASEAGKVIVRFTGSCVSSPGDRILLAASNTPTWGVNQGHTSVEAADSDYNRNSFSHTRVYDVSPGDHTFYAVATRYVETAGTGLASIYGQFTAEFVANSLEAVEVEPIVVTSQNFDTGSATPIVLGSINYDPPGSGKVIVRFDGTCISSPGDRILLAASDDTNWGVSSGHVSMEAVSTDINRNSFCHTQTYDVNGAPQTFYAVGVNYVENDGSGVASVYGHLTVEFVPDNPNYIAESEPINATFADFNSENVLSEVTINPIVPGTAVVTFIGYANVDVGDRLVLAANDEPTWETNDGATSVEAYNEDVNRKPFSHTRVYSVAPGEHTFYAVGHNWVEQEGNGIASVYARIIVKFVSETALGECDDPNWYIPIADTDLPAIQACALPEGYCMASQICADYVIANDPYCINFEWDDICQNAYNECFTSTGCTYPEAENYDDSAFIDDGSCIILSNNCPGDFNGDLNVTVADLTGFLGAFGQTCSF